jgi:hypothetical protein
MERKIAGVLGAVAALGAVNAAQAAPAPTPSDVLKANSYAELLEPIPNAAATLRAVDEHAPAASAMNTRRSPRQRPACNSRKPITTTTIIITTAAAIGITTTITDDQLQGFFHAG